MQSRVVLIELLTATDLTAAAELTLANMQPYYKKYGLEWDSTTILTMTEGLSNLQIILNGEPVGILRLSFTDEVCQLRDLQIDSRFQNKGVGKLVLLEVVGIAEKAAVKFIELKVFKVSPAVRLYTRLGYSVQQQDERFFYMQYQFNKAASE